MPFVTEELWSRLQPEQGSIMVQPYPVQDDSRRFPGEAACADQVIQFVQTVRTVRGENRVKPRDKVDVIAVFDEAHWEFSANIDAEREIIHVLAGIGELTLADSFDKEEGHGHGVGDGFEVFLSLAGLVDVSQERSRIGKELERTRHKISKLAAKLDNQNFLAKAPAEVVDKNRGELSALQAQLHKLNEGLSQLPAG